MGRPKAFLPGPDGRPLLRVALDALAAAGAAPLAIAAHDPAPFAAFGLPVLRDRAAGLGPLGGLESALRAAPGLTGGAGWVLVVACDMPRLDPALLADLLGRARAAEGRGVRAVVPRVEGRAEPLHAAWHTAALGEVTAALDAGRLAVHELLRGLEVEWVDLPPHPGLANANTPADVDW
jgi:molybdopterin-guanine dinucleotide biosynthesis protein A